MGKIRLYKIFLIILLESLQICTVGFKKKPEVMFYMSTPKSIIVHAGVQVRLIRGNA